VPVLMRHKCRTPPAGDAVLWPQGNNLVSDTGTPPAVAPLPNITKDGKNKKSMQPRIPSSQEYYPVRKEKRGMRV
jgi:hypothetical protein